MPSEAFSGMDKEGGRSGQGGLTRCVGRRG